MTKYLLIHKDRKMFPFANSSVFLVRLRFLMPLLWMFYLTDTAIPTISAGKNNIIWDYHFQKCCNLKNVILIFFHFVLRYRGIKTTQTNQPTSSEKGFFSLFSFLNARDKEYLLVRSLWKCWMDFLKAENKQTVSGSN